MRLTRRITDASRAVRLFPSQSLRRLVLEHRAACEEAGLDPGSLDTADDDAVLAWLRERTGALPADLADDIDRIDELTDERGAATLLDVVQESGADLRRLGHDAVEVAVNAFLDHRALFERAHGRRVVETLRRTSEFAGRKPLSAPPVDLAAIRALEADLGRHFEARGKSAHCRIAMGRDGDRVVFEIAHGAPVRTDEALEDNAVREGSGPVYLDERKVRYRPQRRDIVVYDGRGGTIRVRASDAPTLRAYRRGFGELIHGDAEWFGTGPVVSLEPLIQRGAAVEVPTAGLREVRLDSLVILYESGSAGKVTLESDEFWRFAAERLSGPLDDGELLEATFRVARVGRAKTAHVLLQSPHRVDYGSVEEDLFRPWLEARGFLALTPSRLTG